MKRGLLIVGAPLAISLLFMCRIVAKDDTTQELKVEQFKVTESDISGWSARTYNEVHYDLYDGVTEFSQKSVLNGGAFNLSKNQDFRRISAQYFLGTNDRILDIYVFDLGTEALAAEQYQDVAVNMTTLVPGYDRSIAIIDQSSPDFGCKAYAHFGRFFIFLTFDSFQPKADSYDAAKVFLRLMDQKSQ